MKFLRKYVLSIISIFILVGWYGYCVNWDIQNDKKLYESEMKYYQQECKKDVAVCVQKPQLYKMDTLGQMFYTIGLNRPAGAFVLFNRTQSWAAVPGPPPTTWGWAAPKEPDNKQQTAPAP